MLHGWWNISSLRLCNIVRLPRESPTHTAGRLWISQLRQHYTQARNRAHGCAAPKERSHSRENHARGQDALSRHHQMTKKCQWEDFLHNANKIWKAARQFRPDVSWCFNQILFVIGQGQQGEANEGMRPALLSEILPCDDLVRNPDTKTERLVAQQLEWHPQTVDDIKEAVFRARP